MITGITKDEFDERVEDYQQQRDMGIEFVMPEAETRACLVEYLDLIIQANKEMAAETGNQIQIFADAFNAFMADYKRIKLLNLRMKQRLNDLYGPVEWKADPLMMIGPTI